MEGTHIFEGILMVEHNPGKCYIVNPDRNIIIDLNSELARLTGDKIVITITAPDQQVSG